MTVALKSKLVQSVSFHWKRIPGSWAREDLHRNCFLGLRVGVKYLLALVDSTTFHFGPCSLKLHNLNHVVSKNSQCGQVANDEPSFVNSFFLRFKIFFVGYS